MSLAQSTEVLIRPSHKDVGGAGFWDKRAWVLSKVPTAFTAAHRGAKEPALDQHPG